MSVVLITGTEEPADPARKLKEAGSTELRKELTREIRKASAPIVADLKSAIKSLPITGSQGGGRSARARYDLERMHRRDAEKAANRSGLRDTITRAVKAEQRLGGNTPSVKIPVKDGLLPPDQRKPPKHLDSPQGWRHPVFGNRNVRVSQKGRPWWPVTIKPHAEQVRQDILGTAQTRKARSRFGWWPGTERRLQRTGPPACPATPRITTRRAAYAKPYRTLTRRVFGS